MDKYISSQAVLSEIEKVCFSEEWSEFRIDYGSNGTRDYIINYIKQLPPVQPEQKEITMEDVQTYCEQRNLVVLTKDLFNKMSNTADKFYRYLKDREGR